MIQSTQIKIKIAKVLSTLVIFFVGKKKRVKRNGISFELELNEGIDLSIYLFSSFQKHVYDRIPKEKQIKLIFDVGANVGYMSLVLAKAFKQSNVHSFEPTSFALKKLKKNISLNPDLESRINVIQSFVSDVDSENSSLTAYSSWDLSTKTLAKHDIHGGISKSTDGVGELTLDQYSKSIQAYPDLIKIDTDGYEHKVFSGMEEILKRAQTIIVFEVGQYLLKEQNVEFGYFLEKLPKNKYQLIDTQSNQEVTLQNFKTIIPKFGTTDLIAIPIIY